jgi:tetratricopeptide (TPR) repeat protein
VESLLLTALRDILCASLSLDDGLSMIQNISTRDSNESDVLFDIARAIEEIILRRPGLAGAKLTELAIRLSFNKNRTLPELLILLDTRYTNSFRRSECELLPDIEALPTLVDILGELSQAITSTIRLNLRPVLPFLTDEVSLTLSAIYDRRHDGTTVLSLHEVHYLAWILIEAGFFEGAELLLNRVIEISKEAKQKELLFEATFDYACVLTELGMYDQSRDILNRLEREARSSKNQIKLAEVILQLGVNETRDDTIPYKAARKIGDKAAELYDIALKSNLVSIDEVGLAPLIIGSSILANGWREGVSEAVERLEFGLKIYDREDSKTPVQLLHIYRTLCGLGFAHGLMSDHDSMSKAIDRLTQARSILEEIDGKLPDINMEKARVEHTIGWLCLSTDSDEFWDIGIQAFRQAESIREELWKTGGVSDLELLGTRIGLALSLLRISERTDSDDFQEPIRDILVQYIPLFPTDRRAYEEIAIATYDIVWLIVRHGGSISPRLRRLFDDIDRMLMDAPQESVYIQSVSLVVPYIDKSWSILLERSKRMATTDSELSDVSKLVAAMSITRLNLESLNIELGQRVQPTVDDEVQRVDPLLAQYWLGETYLIQTIRAFFANKDYSELATGLYSASVAFGEVLDIEPDFDESVEFIKATSASISQVLRRFALTLENHYAAYIDRVTISGTPPSADENQYSFILSEDWLGLIKIANAYLQMVEESEMVEAQPYLNAVFSNINRALKMMDIVSLIDRRVLAPIGAVMNRRFYLRM